MLTSSQLKTLSKEGGEEFTTQHTLSPQSASIQSSSSWPYGWAEVRDLMGGFFPLPPLPFPFKLTKKCGLPKSQHSAGQVPLAANVQPNKKNTHTKESSIQVQSCDSHGNSRRWVMCGAGSSENSSSSVFSEHFSLAKSELVCQLWGIRSVCSLVRPLAGTLWLFVALDARGQRPEPSGTAWPSSSQNPVH